MAGLNQGGGGGGAGAIRAGRAYVEFLAKDNGLVRGIDKIQARLQGLGNLLLKIGGLGVGLGASLVLPLKAVVDELDDLSRQGSIATAFGLTAEQFTGIAGVAKSAGEDTKEFIESLVTLGKVASEGAAGKGEVATGFFKDLNLNAKEFAALRPDEQFFRFFEAVQAMPDPLKKVRALMVAFGEDGGKYLIPLLEKAPDELRAMAAGFAVSTEDMTDAREASKAYTAATASLGRVWRAVATALSGPVAEAADWVTRLLNPVVALVRENRGLIQTAVMVAAGVSAAAVAVGGLGVGVHLLAAAVGGVLLPLKLVGGLLAFLLTPAGLVVGALAGIGAAWFTMSDHGKRAGAAAGDSFSRMAGTFTSAWGSIVAALRRGDLQTAFGIVTSGFEVLWREMILALTRMWHEFQASTFGSWVVGTVAAFKQLELLFKSKGAGGRGGAGGRPAGGGFPAHGQAVDTLAEWISGWEGLIIAATQGKEAARKFGRERFGQLEQLRKAEDEVNKARDKAELDAATARRDEAQAALDKTLRRARWLQTLKEIDETQARQRKEIEAAKKKSPGAAVAAGLALADTVRGQFGGGLAKQQFGFGDQTAKLLAKQIDVSKEIVGAVEGVQIAIEDAGFVTFKR